MRNLSILLVCICMSVAAFGQATLPLTRTIWNSTATGWTDIGSVGSYTSNFACSGSNMGKIDGLQGYIVNFSGTADQLTFKLKNSSLGSLSELTVSESADNISYSAIGNYTPSNFTNCADIVLSLSSSTRYVKFQYTTDDSGNFGLDDVSITKLASLVNINLSTISGNTTEAGGTATFNVVLDVQPISDVVLNVSSGNTAENTVSPTILTFTSANYNVPQTVTVTGVDDAAIDGNQTTTITVAVDDGNSADAYDGLAEAIDVINEDDECSISNVVATASCNGNDASIAVSWTATNSGGAIEVDVNNNGYATMSSGATYTVTGPTTAATGVTVTVRAVNETTCLGTTTVDIPTCPLNETCEPFNNGTAPSGWLNSGVGFYTSGNFAANSLKFDNTGDYLITPLSTNIKALSFYIKGNSLGGSYSFLVEGYNAGTYTTIEDITSISNAYTQKTYTELPNYSAIRFSYTKGSGNVAFDDACITADNVSTNSLPVELLHFTAKPMDQTAILSWATATEENNAYFNIQRSTDGKNFETIATKAGAGTTYEVQAYSFIDESPVNGLNYYRLQQVDFDEKFENHKIAAVLITEEQNDVAILPTQVRNQFDIAFSETIDGTIEMNIYNLNGQIIQVEIVAVQDNRQTVNVEGLQAGVYIVRLNINNTIVTKRFVKL